MKKIIIILIIVLAGLGLYYYFNLEAPVSSGSLEKKFIINEGDGSTVISKNLKAAGLIRSPLTFQFYTWTKGISSRLLPGEYYIAINLSTRQIAQILNRGVGGKKEKTLTFIEGWNNQQIADYLEQQGFGPATDFTAAISKKAAFWDDYDFLNDKPKDRDLEGYLFPDTYRIYSNAQITDVIKKMLDNFGDKLTPEIRQSIGQQEKTINEIITLASIIEKEVSAPEDRAMVADIFYKRLKEGIPLQSDATVNYVTGKSTTRPSGDDLAVDNIYNTYKYRGLPPGPICNPGIEAIKAAVYPKSNPYFYFLTTPDGKVIYSKTYQEHLTAKNKYYK